MKGKVIMNKYLRFFIISSILISNTHIFAAEIKTIHNFSQKAAMRKYKITDSEIFEELNAISDPDTYNILVNAEIPLIESARNRGFLMQVDEKSGVNFLYK